MTGFGATSSTRAIELHRTLVGRLFGGFRMQPLLLTFALILFGLLIARALGAHVDRSDPVGVVAGVVILLAGIIAIGATGWARADDEGITWRYYLHHHVSWGEIQQVSLRVTGTGIAGVYHSIDVHTAHGRKRVIPAAGGGRARTRFGRELVALAAARGIPTSDDWRPRVGDPSFGD